MGDVIFMLITPVIMVVLVGAIVASVWSAVTADVHWDRNPAIVGAVALSIPLIIFSVTWISMLS